MKNLKQALFVLTFLCVGTSLAQLQRTSNLQEKVDRNQQLFQKTAEIKFYKEESVSHKVPIALSGVLNKASFLELDVEALNETLNSKSEVISIKLPHPEVGEVVLDLVRANIFTPDFEVKVSSDEDNPLHYVPDAEYYWGSIRGDINSFAAIAITRDELVGTFSGSTVENSVVGKMRDGTNKHVIYVENDLLAMPEEGCSMESDPSLPAYSAEELVSISESKSLDNCVRIYVEVEKEVYDEHGSIDATATFVTNVFSQVAALYANEDINVVMSELFIWDTTDPYTAAGTGGRLSEFNAYRTSWNGITW
jgi:hypothetical protein